MKADLIIIGDELLTGLVENTNGGYISRRLLSAGIPVRQQSIVADNTAAIEAAVQEGLALSDMVICSGGLGPTDDDLTRETVAGVLGRKLELHRGWLLKLEQFFSERGYPMPPANRKQAYIIEGGTLIDNQWGTAPGTAVELGKQLIILLPGPPNELRPMFEKSVLPLLAEKRPGCIFMAKTFKCVGLGESLLEEKIKALGRWDQPTLSLVARGLEVDIQIKTNAEPADAAFVLKAAAEQLRCALGSYLYGEDEDTLAGAVVKLFAQHKLTLALAESCSGGLLADSITDVPGSSAFLKGAAVTYSLQAKHLLPGLTQSLLTGEGAVSAAAAEAMARGAREMFDADVGVGITGIAGPDSDGSGSPIGLVYIAATRAGRIDSRNLKFTGTRRAVKEKAVQAALMMLWQSLR